MPTSSPLEPSCVDLRTVLDKYLSNLPPLLAHELNVPLIKARQALTHAIDVVVLGLYHSHEQPSVNTALTQALAKSISTDSLKKINAPAVCHDFFNQKEDEVVKIICQISQLSVRETTFVLGMAAALIKNYVATFVAAARLTASEYREWLAMQSVFVDFSERYPYAPIPAYRHSHQDYRQKLGKDSVQGFVKNDIQLPNHAWLIRLGAMLNDYQKTATPLTLGKSPAPLPKVESVNNQTKSLPKYLTHKKMLIGLGVLAICIIMGLGFWHFYPKDTPKEPPKPPSLPSKDVAIVRVDKETAEPPKSPKSTTNNKPNSKSDGKSK